MTDYKAGQRKFDRWLRESHGLTLAVVDNGLQRDADGWEHFSWTMSVRVGRNGQPYTFLYRAGTAHRAKPTLVDIIGCLISDANCVVDYDFEEFCDNLGYDSDSHKALVMYDQIRVQNADLLRLFPRFDSLAALLRAAEPYIEAAGL